jgi:hypothetical protein
MSCLIGFCLIAFSHLSYSWSKKVSYSIDGGTPPNDTRFECQLNNIKSLESVFIRALSAHSAAEFNILPGRWQHVWLVAIVPTERWGKWTEMTATQHGGTLRH